MPAWDPPPASLPPLPGEVHVWGARLDVADEELGRLERLLSPDERRRADRFHRAADRQHFVAAHGILRKLLGDYLEQDAATLVFHSSPDGKPLLHNTSGPAPIHFNLSHAGGVGVFAFAEREVGVDVESPGRSFRNDAIADRYFPPAEAAALRALEPSARATAFLRSWVCKEAFAKAVGSGLAALDVRSFGLSLDAQGLPCLEGITEAAQQTLAGWTLLELPPLYGCPGALVARGRGWQPRFWLWLGR